MLNLRIYDVPSYHLTSAISAAQKMDDVYTERIGIRNGVAFHSGAGRYEVTLWAYRTPKGMIVVRGTPPRQHRRMSDGIC